MPKSAAKGEGTLLGEEKRSGMLEDATGVQVAVREKETGEVVIKQEPED